MRLYVSATRLFSFSILLLMLVFSSRAGAQFYINEVFFNAPGQPDATQEYIEIRGPANASLADIYLIVLENEISGTANPGTIEAVFDFGSLSNPTLGSNGFLTIRQAGNPYVNLNPHSNNYVNTLTPAFFGSGDLSDVGFTDENNDGELEGSGGTYMLIKNNGGTETAPRVVQGNLIDLDANNDRILDPESIYGSWTVYDSIGINGEASESNGYLYAPINFSHAAPSGAPNVTPGSEFVVVGYEIEYFGRWGNSTGSTAADWHISNLTDNGNSGSDGPGDLRQSGSPHGINNPNQFVETNQGVPYGTKIQATIGGENLFIADGDFTAVYNGEEYVFDGKVDGRDFLIWQRNFGFGLGTNGQPRLGTRRHGDANGDRIVDEADLLIWQANYGYGSSGLSSLNVSVPEPATLGLLTMAISAIGLRSRRK